MKRLYYALITAALTLGWAGFLAFCWVYQRWLGGKGTTMQLKKAVARLLRLLLMPPLLLAMLVCCLDVAVEDWQQRMKEQERGKR